MANLLPRCSDGSSSNDAVVDIDGPETSNSSRDSFGSFDTSDSDKDAQGLRTACQVGHGPHISLLSA